MHDGHHFAARDIDFRRHRHPRVPLQLVLLTGRLDREEWDVRRYLVQEDRVFRGELRDRRLHMTDDDRRRRCA